MEQLTYLILIIIPMLAIGYALTEHQKNLNLQQEIKTLRIRLQNHDKIVDAYNHISKKYDTAVSKLNQLAKLEELKSKAQPSSVKNDHDDNIL